METGRYICLQYSPGNLEAGSWLPRIGEASPSLPILNLIFCSVENSNSSEGYPLLLSLRYPNAYLLVHSISLRLPFLPRGSINILCSDFRCGKYMCLLSSHKSLWEDKHKKNQCYFSSFTSFSHIWLTSFLIFNDISKEDFNLISSLMPPLLLQLKQGWGWEGV